MGKDQLLPSTPPRRGSRWGLLRRPREPAPLDYSSASPPLRGCCLPRRVKIKKVSGNQVAKNVRFLETESTVTPSIKSQALGTPKVLRKRSSHKNVKRSNSRKSFYSAVSTYSKMSHAEKNDDYEDEGEETEAGQQSASPSSEMMSTDESNAVTTKRVDFICGCGHAAHMTSFKEETPLIIKPGIKAGSYEELLIHARSILGNWVTILDRSDSLEPQMLHVGIGKMKRMVMTRLAIPFTAVMEENDTILHCWITTPVGPKHTTASLLGQETFDKDGDLGDWSAVTSMIDYSISWFCGGKPVRAMQMKRQNPKLGTAYETRVCLPDQAEGKILLYNITIDPPPDQAKDLIKVDRVYKFVGR